MTLSRRLAGTFGVTLLVASLATGSAAGHILPSPTFIAQGSPTTISLAVPNERAPHATVGVELIVPRRFTATSVGTTAGFTETRRGQTITWRGGRIQGSNLATFRVALETDAEPGPVTIAMRQRYDDGRSVNWKVPLAVVPGQPGTTQPGNDTGIGWPVPIMIVLGVVAASLAVLLLLRRHRLS